MYEVVYLKKILLLIIIFIFFLCGCGHKHTFDTQWMYDDEYHYHQATCGHDVKSEETMHEFEEEIIKEATHSKEGERVYTCIVCDYTKFEKIDIIEHTFSEDYKYNRTKHYYLCECGEKKDIEEHDYKEGEVVVKATMFNDGLMRYTCKCGSIKEEVIKENSFEFDKEKEEIYLITTSVGKDI